MISQGSHCSKAVCSARQSHLAPQMLRCNRTFLQPPPPHGRAVLNDKAIHNSCRNRSRALAASAASLPASTDLPEVLIPWCTSADVSLRVHPTYGLSAFATRDFKVNDIVVAEEPLLAAAHPEDPLLQHLHAAACTADASTHPDDWMRSCSVLLSFFRAPPATQQHILRYIYSQAPEGSPLQVHCRRRAQVLARVAPPLLHPRHAAHPEASSSIHHKLFGSTTRSSSEDAGSSRRSSSHQGSRPSLEGNSSSSSGNDDSSVLSAATIQTVLQAMEMNAHSVPGSTALFAMNCKLAHTCAIPNTEFIFCGGRGYHVARRNISAGQLLTTTYLGPAAQLMGTAARRQRLWTTFGFVCGCERCSSRPDPLVALPCACCSPAEHTRQPDGLLPKVIALGQQQPKGLLRLYGGRQQSHSTASGPGDQEAAAAAAAAASGVEAAAAAEVHLGHLAAGLHGKLSAGTTTSSSSSSSEGGSGAAATAVWCCDTCGAEVPDDDAHLFPGHPYLQAGPATPPATAAPAALPAHSNREATGSLGTAPGQHTMAAAADDGLAGSPCVEEGRSWEVFGSPHVEEGVSLDLLAGSPRVEEALALEVMDLDQQQKEEPSSVEGEEVVQLLAAVGWTLGANHWLYHYMLLLQSRLLLSNVAGAAALLRAQGSKALTPQLCSQVEDTLQQLGANWGTTLDWASRQLAATAGEALTPHAVALAVNLLRLAPALQPLWQQQPGLLQQLTQLTSSLLSTAAPHVRPYLDWPLSEPHPLGHDFQVAQQIRAQLMGASKQPQQLLQWRLPPGAGVRRRGQRGLLQQLLTGLGLPEPS